MLASSRVWTSCPWDRLPCARWCLLFMGVYFCVCVGLFCGRTPSIRAPAPCIFVMCFVRWWDSVRTALLSAFRSCSSGARKDTARRAAGDNVGGHQHRGTKAYSPALVHPGAASACASAAQRVIPHLRMGGRCALETFSKRVYPELSLAPKQGGQSRETGAHLGPIR